MRNAQVAVRRMLVPAPAPPGGGQILQASITDLGLTVLHTLWAYEQIGRKALGSGAGCWCRRSAAVLRAPIEPADRSPRIIRADCTLCILRFTDMSLSNTCTVHNGHKYVCI